MLTITAALAFLIYVVGGLILLCGLLVAGFVVLAVVGGATQGPKGDRGT